MPFLLCSWLTDFVNVSKVMQTNFLNSEENNGFLKSLNCILIIQTLNQSSQDNADQCYTFLAFSSSSWNLSYFDRLTLLMQEKTYFTLNMFPTDWFCECFNLILIDFLNFMFLFPDLETFIFVFVPRPMSVSFLIRISRFSQSSLFNNFPQKNYFLNLYFSPNCYTFVFVSRSRLPDFLD